jgi:hypothetical protein
MQAREQRAMDTDREKLALERKLANYRELAREFPDEQIGQVIRDCIEELEQQLRPREK